MIIIIIIITARPHLILKIWKPETKNLFGVALTVIPNLNNNFYRYEWRPFRIHLGRCGTVRMVHLPLGHLGV